MVVDDADDVLADLDLTLVRFKVDFDRVVTSDRVAVEDLHAAWRHLEALRQDEIFRRWE